MADVKALFPIGKTQWSKWNDTQRVAFNEAREAGVPFADAVQAANETRASKKKGIFDIIEDVVETVEDVAEIANTVAPVVAMAKIVAKRPRTKKGN